MLFRSEARFVERCSNNLEEIILREGPETITALIAEPVMGVAGMIPPPERYFAAIRAVLQRHDILFHADEVYTGFFRTGPRFASDTFSAPPDLMTIGKALTSAYFPLSALVISGEIYRVIESQSSRQGVLAHGFTYGGHPTGCAVALETLRIYEEDQIVSRVRERATQFASRMEKLNTHPLVGEVRGKGLLAGVELMNNAEARARFEPKLKAGALCARIAEQHGLIVRAIGDTIAFCPPLIISETEIEEMLARFRRALDDTASELGLTRS